MWTYREEYDVIVVGAGHAGCEAAHAAAQMGAKTLLLTMTLDTIAKMSCNPAVGGTAKGHLVREIDALGGLMGKVTDRTAIQYRMLNASKGPAVWSPRAQTDKFAYAAAMKQRLERISLLHIKQGTTESLLVENDTAVGVITLEGIAYRGKSVVLSAGTFMRGLIHMGTVQFPGGRAGDKPSTGLSAHLEALGFSLIRLKTGTPPRIHRRSVDFSKMEEQKGDEGVRFSYDEAEGTGLPQTVCHITYTNEATKKVVLDNLHRAPLYSGQIKGVGPRYCPSIEDKVVRFGDKERHQIFLEPEGLDTDEMYVNGISSSLPIDVQLQFLHTISGLEKAEVMRYAYAIEYDAIQSGQLGPNLETKKIEGLFLCGQINATTGYEEAAAQGLIAGVNAALKVARRPAFILLRSEAYIGVMIDDLILKQHTEPYRVFTSLCEHRLLLRHDNADLRLRAYGHELGLIDAERYHKLQEKRAKIAEQITFLSKTFDQIGGKGVALSQLLRRAGYTYERLMREYPHLDQGLSPEITRQVEIELKYEGYIQRQKGEVAKLQGLDTLSLPKQIQFLEISGLSNEAKEKLHHFQPTTLGQASRIAGVSPADISVLLVYLKSKAP